MFTTFWKSAFVSLLALSVSATAVLAESRDWREVREEYHSVRIAQMYVAEITREVRNRALSRMNVFLRQAEQDLRADDLVEERKVDIVSMAYSHMLSTTAPARVGLEAEDGIVTVYEQYAERFEVDLTLYHEWTHDLVQLIRDGVTSVVIDHQRYSAEEILEQMRDVHYQFEEAVVDYGNAIESKATDVTNARNKLSRTDRETIQRSVYRDLCTIQREREMPWGTLDQYCAEEGF